MKPKVLIGCPTYFRYRYCLDDYIDALKNLDHDNFDIFLVDNSPDNSYYGLIKQKGISAEKIGSCEPARERIIRSRNILRKKTLDEGYDYLFSVEQDVIITPETLKQLLSHDKKIISAYYGNDLLLTLKHRQTGELKKAKVNLPLVYLQQGAGQIKRANAHEVMGRGVISVGAAGLGCMLIHREVLEKIPFRYEPEKKAFDDMHFCSDAKNLGYKIFLDSDLKAVHLHKDWKGIQK